MDNPLLDFAAPLPRFSAIRPEHVEAAVTATIDDNRRAIEAVLASGGEQASFASAILPLEELSDRLHRVWAPIGHLHAVANTPALREAYNRCLPTLTRYHTELAQNGQLFELLQRVAQTLPPGKDPAAQALLEQAIRDFRLAGVALPAEQKKRFAALMEELAELQAKFEQNLLDSMAAWHHDYPAGPPPEGVPEQVVEQARRAAADAGIAGYRFGLDQPTYVGVVTHAVKPELRAIFHRAWATRASDEVPADPRFDNGAVLERILALRDEAAKLVGFANFAAYSLATKMAKSVAEVREFIEKLVAAARPAAQREFAELQAFAGRRLAAADVAYYSEQLLRERYHVSDEELRPYFPLPRVLEGLFGLVHQLYGLQLVAKDDAEVWHPEVRYFRVLESRGEAVGGLYLDLYARPEKRSGAWMDDCLDRKNFGGATQVPIAHLVCNFSPPGAAAPSLLSHDDVLTLFHEMGHALHHLLTRVDYPSVAGIHGVPWDAVELPSQFMEGFAWEPAIVPMISGHHLTGEPLPIETLERLRASRVFQGAMHMVRQLEFSLFDMRLHSEYSPEIGARAMDLLREVRAKVAVVPAASYDRLPNGFSHVFGGGYAAGYYSYKWAEVLSADAFAAFEEQGVLNPELAQRFREQILEIGGTSDIGEAFRRFRGRAPDIGPLLRHTGIKAETPQ